MKPLYTLKRSLAAAVFALGTFALTSPASAQTPPASTNTTDSASSDSSGEKTSKDPVALIREEGLNHSQATEILSYLSDVIGARLTGSPNLIRANEWTRDKFKSWGMINSHLEAWGPFGRGWSLKRFSAEVVEPQDIPLKAYPNAWSPGFDKPLNANVVYLDATNAEGLEQYKGKLKGAVVLVSPIRDVKERFDPLAVRLNETNLLELANAAPPSGGRGGGDLPAGFNRGARGGGRRGGRGGPSMNSTNASGTNTFAGPRGGGRGGGQRNLGFAAKEGASLIVSASGQGDSGTIFVMSASIPPTDTERTNTGTGLFGRGGGGGGANTPRVYSTNAPAYPAQITVAVEDYNRMVRMIQAGEKLKMAVDLRVQFHTKDPMAYNTIAEIPGTDLKNEIVMLGGHMDSWQSGTGATDNGAGVAATMEAVRILQACKLKPRRTIRIALWSGEEEGLLGSKAYVTSHFGYMTNITNSSKIAESDSSDSSSTNSRSRRQLVPGPEYDKLSAYFNLDNGAGKIRGVYMQGNEAVRPLFRKWLEPFADLEAETLTPSNTGSTDHISFDAVGLPAFEFLQDPLDYSTRTHHSNEDVFDRIQPDDLKQAATIIAAFVYNAAMLDEQLPRKPLETTGGRRFD